MSLLKWTLRNLFAVIFWFLGLALIGLSFFSCSIVLPFVARENTGLKFLIIFSIGLILLLISRAWSRGRS